MVLCRRASRAELRYDRHTSPADWLKLMILLFLFRWGLHDGRMDSLITARSPAEGIKQVSYWGDNNNPAPF